VSDTNEQFRELVDELAAIQGWSVAAVIRLAGKHGLSQSWVKERYYQRAAVKPGDVAKVEALRIHFLQDNDLDDSDPKSSATFYRERIQELSWGLEHHREAVARMCHACAEPDEGEEAMCWLASCPLRKISPLPLRPKQERRP
jgi:hypothetical protein